MAMFLLFVLPSHAQFLGGAYRWAGRKVITYYGDKCLFPNGATSGTPIKEITVVFEDGDPVSINRLGNRYSLSYRGMDGDLDEYLANEDRRFSFFLPGDKDQLMERYNSNGMIVYTFYTSTPSTNNGSGSYNGGDYYGGNLPNYNTSPSGSNNSGDLTCPSCHGTGKCTGCAGRGEYRGNGTLLDCPVCNGRGTCRGCYGKGTIRR